ncbi:MAG: hypothetical protein K6B40_00320 [Firmicutes bacterium]|nr:hypothetical protein [Bacillota bacterium]
MELTTLSRRLQALTGSPQLSHAYLFCGSGALQQALNFSAALLCGQPAEGSACGHCSACIHFLAGTHSGFQWITASGGGHKIETIRHLHKLAYLSTLESPMKVFLLQDAELMGEPAANCLLKILEEPPENCVFILTANHLDSLLPTIVSRCQRFSFASDEETETAAVDMQAAACFLRELPSMPISQVLLIAKEREKDAAAQEGFFAALLRVLHQAAVGKTELPMGRKKALDSAIMMENAIDYLRKRVRQQLLTDVILLRLWQNSRSEG